MKFTVLGSTGFIGSHLVSYFRQKGYDVLTPLRNDSNLLTQSLGHVFYCIGLTANFRSQPFDTVEAHVCLLKRLLEQGHFESLVYLSSTRIYDGVKTTNEETSLQVSPNNPGHIYNISKLMGESMCLASGCKTKVARLSNVFGYSMPEQTFLVKVLKEAVNTNKVHFLTTASSTKDYVSIFDVVHWLLQVALYGEHTIYNIASGNNISNSEIALLLERKGVSVSFALDAPEWSFPIIDTKRLQQEFGRPQKNLHEEFDYLFDYFSNPLRNYK